MTQFFRVDCLAKNARGRIQSGECGGWVDVSGYFRCSFRIHNCGNGPADVCVLQKNQKVRFLIVTIHQLRSNCGMTIDLISGVVMQKNIRMVTCLGRQDILPLLILNLKRMALKGLELQVTEDYPTYQILFSTDLKTLLLATVV